MLDFICCICTLFLLSKKFLDQELIYILILNKMSSFISIITILCVVFIPILSTLLWGGLSSNAHFNIRVILLQALGAKERE